MQLEANETATQQPAATVEEIVVAVTLAPDVATKVALILTWLCAGRVGDVLKVARREVTLAPDFATTGDLTVKFSRGKGARFNQPYTVPSTCPEEWRGLLNQFLAPLQPADWLFPGQEKVFGPAVKMALRTANPTYTVRALRRGALQRMAKAGVPHETLMTFSGHKRLDTLMRYLDWGAEAGLRVQAARAAATNLVA